MTCALGLFLFSALAQPAPQGSSNPKIPTVSVETYRAQLQRALARLKQIEARPPRRLTPILNSLATTQRIKRKDGQTQTASGDEWQRFADNLGASPTTGTSPLPMPTPKKPTPAIAATQNFSREDAQRVRESVEVRLRALDQWSASTYAPADAQGIIKQLEGSGQIRTGPTWLQQFTADVGKWFRNTMIKFMRWIAGLFPSATPGKMPIIDPFWIKAVFYLTVFALLALLMLLVWRAVGGRIGKRGARRGVLAEGEDAELLLLPPDELRLRASQFAREGNFREALRHLYIALLLSLDARGVWRYDARRTNWEHIAALRNDASRSTLVSSLSNITRVFDRVRYGNAAFNDEDWRRFESEVNGVEARTANG